MGNNIADDAGFIAKRMKELADERAEASGNIPVQQTGIRRFSDSGTPLCIHCSASMYPTENYNEWHCHKCYTYYQKPSEMIGFQAGFGA